MGMRLHRSLPWLFAIRTISAFSARKLPPRSQISTTVFRMASADITDTSRATAMALPKVSSKIQTTLDPCVVLMKELIGKYADLWKGRGGIYSLAQGVVYWKPPESCQDALRQAILSADNDMHLYGPDEGLPEFREMLREKVAVENGLTNHDIMVTVGANQAYVNCVLTLLSSGDTTSKAVVFAPYYFNHVMALQMVMSNDNILIGPTNDKGFPDLTWLEQQLAASDESSSIDLVTLVNPGNPTGVTLPRDFVQRVVDLTRKYNCWLVLDATYEYFVEAPVSSKGGDDDFGFDACFNEPHVIHIFSLSKAYALAGYRCGYIAVHNNSNLYEQMLKVQDTIPIAPSRISQIAGMGALQAGRDWVKDQVATLETGRNAILKALQPLEVTMGGSGAMYVMGKLPAAAAAAGTILIVDDQEVANILVRDYGVAVIPGSYCGFPGWIRVCYANLPPDKCLQAAARLEQGVLDIVNGRVEK